ncbi:MAG TPA: GNAT family N-acetyltransferase [Myxococcota bacterium]|nr:GNAT family N-acetyltransferase [Myxococcota bacterium]
MEIRLLTAEDAPLYRPLRLRMLSEHPEAFTSSAEEEALLPMEALRQRLSSRSRFYWGAFEGGRLLGTVGLDCEQRKKNAHKATVVGMYVAREHSGHGLGRALLSTLLSEARHRGLEVLVLTVTEGNHAAIHLYESLGFCSFGLEPRAIQVQGRAYAKLHMILELQPSTPSQSSSTPLPGASKEPG